MLDMDTREGYEEVLAYHRKDEEPVKDRLKGKRLFLVRHGEIHQHREKIFLGQTDIPLSDKGRTQAAKAAEDLKNHGISVKRIYTSDLSRAAETAEIIGKQLAGGAQEIHVVPVPALREMSLGSWDGQYIREIRERYPEEYRKRGEDLLSYKFGNDSENFYDLQYRVMKGFFDILKQEAAAADSGKTAADSRDILIVAHQGVISVVLSSLRHTDLKEEMNNGIPNGGIAIFIVD